MFFFSGAGSFLNLYITQLNVLEFVEGDLQQGFGFTGIECLRIGLQYTIFRLTIGDETDDEAIMTAHA